MERTKQKSYFGGNGSVATAEKKVRRRSKDDMREAYDIGFARGWEDTYELPKRAGAKKVASKAYKEGARNHQRSDKYISKYKKRG